MKLMRLMSLNLNLSTLKVTRGTPTIPDTPDPTGTRSITKTPKRKRSKTRTTPASLWLRTNKEAGLLTSNAEAAMSFRSPTRGLQTTKKN